MLIDVTHRENLQVYSKSEYETLYTSCVTKLKKMPEISSIILCGSLAKNDLIEGWSDIDLVVFARTTITIELLLKIKLALLEAKGNYNIGLGIDIVNEYDFYKSKKFGGRPLTMSYEVAAYGILAYGKNYLSSLTYDTEAEIVVNRERRQLIAAEIHSWRRQFIFSFDKAPLSKLFGNAKALLRILQCEVGPNLSLPINTRNNLEKFKAHYPNHGSISAFELAVTIRSNWVKYFSYPDSQIEEIIDSLNKSITTYPVFYEC